MGQEKILFKSEEPRTASDIAEFLQQLAGKIKERQITLSRNDEKLVIDLPENLILELKVEEEIKKGKTKRSFEIEIEWLENGKPEGKVQLG